VVVQRAAFALLIFALPSAGFAASLRTPDGGASKQPVVAKSATPSRDGGVSTRPASAKVATPSRDGGVSTRPASAKVATPSRDGGVSMRPLPGRAVVSKRPVPAKKPKAPRNPPVELFQINTKETINLRFADERGRPINGWQKRFQRFMRCHHTNSQHKMDPRLARLLYQVGRHFPGHRLEVVSGFRNPKVASNPRSPHKLGLACDFHVAGVTNTALRDYLRHTFQRVGVGYYPNSMFVHLDVRKGPSAFWIDYSGPGEGAVYSGNARDDLRTGVVDWYKPSTGNRKANERAESVDDLMETAVRGGARAAPPGTDSTKASAAVRRAGETPNGTTN
jgi:uncharacterized protein YcbK (DUF882 family)